MTYDAHNERFFILNKVLYKCMSCHYKTLLSLGNCQVEQDNLPLVLVSDFHHQATRFFLRDKMSSTAQRYICIFIQKWLKTNKETGQESGYYVQTVRNRAVRCGQKKNYHDFLFFLSISILITILTQTDMLYSYKCILCELETYFQRKPLRPFPKSCKMSLEQTYGKIHIYIYIYIYIYIICICE